MKKTTVSLAISTLLWLGAIASQHAWSHSAHANQHVLWSSSSAHAKDPWQTLPPPVVLPSPRYNGTAKINNIDLWYGTYGASLQDSQAYGHSPVVFLHGGFANSEYFGNQITHLARQATFSLIAIDSRAQGRSSDDASIPITYDQMTLDVISLMDHLSIPSFSVVGWSDGGCIAFDLAMNFSSRIDRIFSFGGTYHHNCINETALETSTFQKYMAWVKADFERLSPEKEQGFEAFEKRMLEMWSMEPTWGEESFRKVSALESSGGSGLDVDAGHGHDPPMIWIVAGDSEEAVTRRTPGDLHRWIPASSLVTLPAVSHFAFLQDPATFNAMLERFLTMEKRGSDRV